MSTFIGQDSKLVEASQFLFHKGHEILAIIVFPDITWSCIFEPLDGDLGKVIGLLDLFILLEICCHSFGILIFDLFGPFFSILD